MKKILIECLLLICFTLFTINARADSYNGYTTNIVNLRLGPTADSPKLKQLDKGAELYIFSEIPYGGFLKVIDVKSNTEGYVHENYVFFKKRIEPNLSSNDIITNIVNENEVYRDDDLSITIFRNTIKKKGDYYFCWVEWKYLTQKSRYDYSKNMIDLCVKNGEMAEAGKWKNFEYSKWYYMIDCVDNKYKLLHSVSYSKDGSVIYSYNNSNNAEWIFVVPESIFESIYYSICGN
jgi:hypothetical protein